MAVTTRKKTTKIILVPAWREITASTGNAWANNIKLARMLVSATLSPKGKSTEARTINPA